MNKPEENLSQSKYADHRNVNKGYIHNYQIKTKPLTFLLALNFLFLFSGSVYGKACCVTKYQEVPIRLAQIWPSIFLYRLSNPCHRVPKKILQIALTNNVVCPVNANLCLL